MVPLKEYRCTCGRLLLKGLFLVAVIEIKCKRCGVLAFFKEGLNRDGYFTFVIVCDDKGVIVDMCLGAERILEHSRKELIGYPASKICPSLSDTKTKDEISESLRAGAPYGIPSNIFILRDGNQMIFDSHFVPTHNQSEYSGYKIYSHAIDRR